MLTFLETHWAEKMELDLHVVLKIMDNVKTHLVAKNKTRISQTRCAKMSIYAKP